MTKKVMIIVDMQKDFMHGGALGLPQPTLALEKTIAAFVECFDGPIIATQDTHHESSCEFDMFPKHCVSGTEGHQVSDVIEGALAKKEHVMRFNKTSFGSKDLAKFLSECNEYEEMHVVGVCTHICVHDIIVDIVNQFKSAHNKIPKIILHRALTDDFNPEMAKFSIKRLQSLYGVEVI